jgi:hypothetical protein
MVGSSLQHCASFAPRILLNNCFTTRNSSLGGSFIRPPLRFRIQFDTHCHDVANDGVKILEEHDPRNILDVSGIDEEDPRADPVAGLPVKSEASASLLSSDMAAMAAMAGRVGDPRDEHGAAERNIVATMSTSDGADKLRPPTVNSDMAEMLAHMDALQRTVSELAGCIATIELVVDGHGSLAPTTTKAFDKIQYMLGILSGNRGCVIAGQHGGLLPLPNLGPTSDNANSVGPRHEHMHSGAGPLRFHLQPRPGSGDAQGNKVPHGGYLMGPAK